MQNYNIIHTLHIALNINIENIFVNMAFKSRFCRIITLYSSFQRVIGKPVVCAFSFAQDKFPDIRGIIAGGATITVDVFSATIA